MDSKRKCYALLSVTLFCVGVLIGHHQKKISIVDLKIANLQSLRGLSKEQVRGILGKNHQLARGGGGPDADEHEYLFYSSLFVEIHPDNESIRSFRNIPSNNLDSYTPTLRDREVFNTQLISP